MCNIPPVPIAAMALAIRLSARSSDPDIMSTGGCTITQYFINGLNLTHGHGEELNHDI
jgi:hypothetical protein